MSEECKYCKTSQTCLEMAEYGSIYCLLHRRIPRVIEKTYEELQRENQELKKQVEKYKKVINEAIDMIEKMTESELNYINYKNEKHLICGSDFGEGADIIVSILKEVE